MENTARNINSSLLEDGRYHCSCGHSYISESRLKKHCLRVGHEPFQAQNSQEKSEPAPAPIHTAQNSEQATPKQVGFMKSLGIEGAEGVSKKEASKLIAAALASGAKPKRAYEPNRENLSKEEFEKVFKEFYEKKSERDKLTKEVLPPLYKKVSGYVQDHGQHTKPGTDDSILYTEEGFKVQWQFRTKEEIKLEGVALEFARNEGKFADGQEHSELIQLVPAINWNEWNKARDAGLISSELQDAVIKKGHTYALVVRETGKKSCPECGHTIKKADKFCSECGHKLQ